MKGPGKDDDEDTFLKLIREIVSSKKTVLFAPVTDKGPVIETTDYAPVGLNGVIKICSSTILGQLSNENQFAQPDFLLPGERIALENKKVSGSSFSTAYAAGLAALVLCCLRAHIQLDDPDAENDGQDERVERLKKARTYDGMKTIFKILSGRNAEDEQKNGFFIRPYLTFGSKFGDSRDDMSRVVKRIAAEMLPSKTPRTLS